MTVQNVAIRAQDGRLKGVDLGVTIVDFVFGFFRSFGFLGVYLTARVQLRWDSEFKIPYSRLALSSGSGRLFNRPFAMLT